MAINSFRRQGGQADEVSRLQANVDNALKGLNNSIILDGVYVEDVSISTTATSIAHKLGRPYRGYIICKNNTYCDIKVANNTSTELFLNLQASASCTVSLWIF